jgi:hypothetical protein
VTGGTILLLGHRRGRALVRPCCAPLHGSARRPAACTYVARHDPDHRLSPSDARRLMRLEVRGEVSGRLVEHDLPLMLRNMSGGGFLAETSADLPPGSLHTVKLRTHDGLAVVVTAR